MIIDRTHKNKEDKQNKQEEQKTKKEKKRSLTILVIPRAPLARNRAPDRQKKATAARRKTRAHELRSVGGAPARLRGSRRTAWTALAVIRIVPYYSFLYSFIFSYPYCSLLFSFLKMIIIIIDNNNS